MLVFVRNLLKSLRSKIIVSLFVLIILPVVVIVYHFYHSSMEIVRQQLYQSNQVAVERKAEAMNETAARMLNASNLLAGDPETEKFMRDPGNWINNYDSFSSFKVLDRKLSNMRDMLLESNSYLALYDYSTYAYSTWAGAYRSRLTDESWYDRTSELKGFPYWFAPYAFKKSEDAAQPLLAMTRQLNGETSSGYGFMFIGIPLSSFFYNEDEISRQAEHGIRNFLVNEGKVIIGEPAALGMTADALSFNLSTANNGFKKTRLQDETYLVNDALIPQLGWHLVQLMSEKDFLAQLNMLRNKSISWVIAFFLLFTIAFIGLMIRFTSPIKQLIRSMNHVGIGNFDAMVTIKGEDEFAVLGNRFNHMVTRLHELIRNLSLEQQRKQKAQFQALQAQMNPHFLTNTLNSIKWMAILSGAGHVSEMITKLGKLVNYSMRSGTEFITLGEELDYLSVYMSLQEIRYHDQITVAVEVPEHLLPCRVLKFSLQPAVENSIKHGSRFPLHIRIHARSEDDKLSITVEDDGVGMNEETIQAILAADQQSSVKFSGIGLRNIHDRIRLHFGAAYGIHIDSKPNEGLRFTLTIPLQGGERDDSNLDRG